MAGHDLFLSIPAKVLLNKDATLDVYSDKAKLGTLMMSRGSVAWQPARHQSAFHLKWEAFDALMQSAGRPRKTSGV